MRLTALVCVLVVAVSVRAGDSPAKPRTLGMTPKAAPQQLAKFNQFVEGVVDPQNTLDLVEGRARLIRFKQAPTQIQVADPTLLASRFVKSTDLTVIGRRAGTTVLNLWFPDPAKKGKERVLSYLVRVVPDPEAKARLALAYRVLGFEINQAFPNSRVEFKLVGDKPLVTRQAHDIREAGQILQIVK